LEFGTANDGLGTQKMVLDVSGSLSLNTTRVSGNNTNILTLTDNVTGLQASGFGVRILATSNNGQAKSAIAFEADGGTNNDTAISFYTQTSAVSLNKAVSITKNANLNILNGNLVIGTAGKGIDFSATPNSSGSMTSELLNDYEEGTFTATLKGSVSDPTSPVTTTGYYTKVGNKVTIWVEFASVDTTGASGEVFVQGLPFTSSTNCKSPGGVVTFNLNFNSAEYLTAFMTSNGTSFELLGARSSSTWTVATHTASVNVYLVATITYFV
jgi:hypothetical protein